MKLRQEHNVFCISRGIHPTVCDKTNRWMDAPAKRRGGCAHRKQRHSLLDCLKWSISAGSVQEAKEYYVACQAHREADRKTDLCDSESLRV